MSTSRVTRPMIRAAQAVGTLVLTAGLISVFATPRAAAGQPDPAGQFYRLLPRADVPGPAAPGPWLIEPTPNPPGQRNGRVLSVSCTSASACMGVGSWYGSTGITVPLAERWNGKSWAARSAPSPSGAAWSRLFAVSCPASSDCIATGYYVSRTGQPRPLAERWNGTQWSIQPTPSPAKSRASGLFALSCSSSRACTATGEYNNGQRTPQTLAERWDGTRWRIQATPNPAGAQASGLFGVSCPAAKDCLAVGSVINGSGTTLSLAMTWHGSGWTIHATRNPAGAASAQLLAVSCTAPQACTAVGGATATGQSQPLAEGWNGTNWELQPAVTPPGAAGSELTAVSCTAPRACTAAGSSTGNDGPAGTLPLAEGWNGTQWAIQPTPSPAGNTGGGFAGLSCGAARCTAVGSYAPGTGQADVPVAEGRTGGTWTIQPIPAKAGAVFSEFAAVSCSSPPACTAIGASATAPGQITPLAEQWNGRSWRIQAIPGPAGAIITMLSAVSCAAPQACMATGSYVAASGATLPLAEVWNGATWTVQVIPLPAKTTGGQFQAVSCPTPQACTAVGSYTRKGQSQPLAERWNGATWQIQTLGALTGVTAPSLAGVSCPTTQACTAVGAASKKGQSQPLAERWNGATWTAQPVPLPTGATSAQLQAVSCPTGRACTATGGDSSATSPTLAERWNGSTWHVQPTPTPPGHTGPLGVPALSSVSCVRAHGCTATGNYTRGNQPAYFIEAWNGSHWSLPAAPSPPGTTSGALGAVSCTQTGCTAAGGYTGLTGIAVTLALTTAP